MGITGSDRAPRYAMLNVARLGATRLGYYSPKTFIQIDGVERGYQADDPDEEVVQDLTIELYRDHTPNTATFTVKGFAVTEGMEVLIRQGSLIQTRSLIAGKVLNVTQGYAKHPSTPVWTVHVIDRTWEMNQRKVTARYTATSATTIARALIAGWAIGFTQVIQDGLDEIDEITFTNQDVTDCLTHLFTRIGGTWRCGNDYDVHGYVGDDPSAGTPPTPLVDFTNTTLTAFQATRDLSQILTRVCGEGGGSNAAADTAAGSTILLVDDAAWYSSSGGTVVCGPQRITYTGKITGAATPFVAPPDTAPTLTLNTGEFADKPYPAGLGGIWGFDIGDQVSVRMTYVNALGETTVGPASNTVTIIESVSTPTYPCGVDLSSIPVSGDGTVTSKRAYIYVNGVAQTYHSLSSGATTGEISNSSDVEAPEPAANTAALPRSTLTGIPASGAGAIVWPILKGDPVNVRTQADNVSAQTVIGTLLTTAKRTHDGVIEGFIQDGRLSETELLARCQAQLDLYDAVEIAPTYTVRDVNTQPGRDVEIDLPDPTNCTGTFKIQKVTLSNFRPAVQPTREVQASTVRFSFDDLLRMIRKAAA